MGAPQTDHETQQDGQERAERTFPRLETRPLDAEPCSSCEGIGFGIGPGGLDKTPGSPQGWCPRCYGAQVEPYYAEGGITIFHGDCREVLPLIQAKVDLVLVTDPPYNRSKEYGTHDDDMGLCEYDRWLESWWVLIETERRVVFPSVGNIGLWFKRQPVATACWYKPGAPGRANPFQWNEWEPILVWRLAFSGSDVFRAPVGEQAGVGDHPCPKPLPLMRQILERMRYKEGSILDPFMGSGTTLRAAKDLGRKAIGIEIEERYCEIAAKRMAQEVLPLET